MKDESDASFTPQKPRAQAESEGVSSRFSMAAFAARDGAGALTYKDQMFVIGGWNPDIKKFFPRICNNEVWSSRDGATWTLVKPNTFIDKSFDKSQDWEGRHTAGYVVHRDKMW